MSGFLFEQIIFGPVKSRRLGISLGINLLPTDHKACSFNCLYCECGWTLPHGQEGFSFPSRTMVREALEDRLRIMAEKHSMITAITFAGNGEPTLHPEFPGIVDDTLKLRDMYYPGAKTTVLSNSSMLHKEEVLQALLKTDQPVMKLDAGTESCFQTLNNPRKGVTLMQIVDKLKRFQGQLIIQTLFVRGTHKNTYIDNTCEEEVQAWLGHIRDISPSLVMLYPIARVTPAEGLEKVPGNELLEIAARVESLGIAAEVYG